MKTYFNIRYEFDHDAVINAITERISNSGSDYICVADGVILDNANRNPDYLRIVNGGMFSICDSSYVPLYIKWIYGHKYPQYSGSQIFRDIIQSGNYKMLFLGASKEILTGLKSNLSLINSEVKNMQFIELPYKKAEEFDYIRIAEIINKDNPDIIWVSLGAPKQEWFMHYLKPYLNRGVIIAVGAAFKFYSGSDVKRAPQWMIDHHLEFLYRLLKEPTKQWRRCFGIINTLPMLLCGELKRKRNRSHNI